MLTFQLVVKIISRFFTNNQQTHWFPEFIFAKKWTSTCFWQSICPSSRDHSLYTWHWYMAYGLESAYEHGLPALFISWLQTLWHIPVPSAQLTKSWWWAEELSETCRGSFLAKINSVNQCVCWFYCKEIYYDARSHERKIFHVLWDRTFITVCTRIRLWSFS
jgi:hypothetical protein